MMIRLIWMTDTGLMNTDDGKCQSSIEPGWCCLAFFDVERWSRVYRDTVRFFSIYFPHFPMIKDNNLNMQGFI